MTSMSDNELLQTETLLRQRLAQLADLAPTAVHVPGEVPVVAAPRRTRHRGRRAGVIAAVTALIGAGGFTTYSYLGAADHGGAATPAEAVNAFVAAAEQEDVLGMIDVTLPEEVGVLRGALDSITSDAKRTGLVTGGFDSNGVTGVNVSVDHLALDTNFLEGGLAAVTATAGTISASLDPRSFPFGDKLRELIGRGDRLLTASATLGPSDPLAMLMTVERDGRWYVSVEYTIAEYVRRAAGWDEPGAVTRTPVGFASPEDAVNGFYDRLGALDLQGAMDTFAPGEDAMAWLASMWAPDAQAAIDKARTAGWSVAISGLTYETIGDGDHLTLKPLTFKVEGTVPGDLNSGSSAANPTWPTVVSAVGGAEYALVPPGQVPATTAGLTFSAGFPSVDGGYNFTTARADATIVPLVFPAAPTAGPKPFTIERSDGCTTYLGDGARAMFGLDSSPLFKPIEGGYQLCGAGSAFGLAGAILFLGGYAELPPVSVAQSGGKWYISPLGTALASVSTGLHDVKDGSSLFDSPLAPFLYGGLGRSGLDSIVKGQPADSIDPACLPALSVDNGKVTGVVADPPPDATRMCVQTIGAGGSVSQSSGSVTVTGAPAAVPEPQATTAP